MYRTKLIQYYNEECDISLDTLKVIPPALEDNTYIIGGYTVKMTEEEVKHYHPHKNGVAFMTEDGFEQSSEWDDLEIEHITTETPGYCVSENVDMGYYWYDKKEDKFYEFDTMIYYYTPRIAMCWYLKIMYVNGRSYDLDRIFGIFEGGMYYKYIDSIMVMKWDQGHITHERIAKFSHGCICKAIGDVLISVNQLFIYSVVYKGNDWEKSYHDASVIGITNEYIYTLDNNHIMLHNIDGKIIVNLYHECSNWTIVEATKDIMVVSSSDYTAVYNIKMIPWV